MKGSLYVVASPRGGGFETSICFRALVIFIALAFVVTVSCPLAVGFSQRSSRSDEPVIGNAAEFHAMASGPSADGFAGKASASVAFPSPSGHAFPLQANNVAGVESQAAGRITPPAGYSSWTLGGAGEDAVNAVCVSGDDGYVLAGYTKSKGAGDSDVYLAKLDAFGNLKWEKTYGGPRHEIAHSIQLTSDGGFIVAGEATSEQPNEFGNYHMNAYLLKVDANGNYQWDKQYGSWKGEGAYCVKCTRDGGFILAGFTTLGAGGFDKCLWKTDARGNLVWQKNVNGQASWDALYCVEQLPDGSYMVAGSATNFGSQFQDVEAYLARVSSTGDLVWEKFFSGCGMGEDEFKCLQRTADGGFILAGETITVEGTYGYVVKTDASGNEVWSKCLGPDIYGGYGFDCVRQLSSGGYILVGYASEHAENYVNDLYLVRMDSSGKTLWERFIGGANHDAGMCVRETVEGGFILAGWTESFGAGNKDAWLVWTDWNGNLAPTWRAGIRLGDILLCRSASILSPVLTYTHAGIYVGNWMVAEARPEKARSEEEGGIALYPIEDWDYPRQTYVSLYRVNTTRAKREAAASWARTQTRRDPRPVYQWQYIDRSALQNSPSWYCSELVWAAYWNQGIDLAVVGGMGPAQVRYPVSPDHLVDKGKEDGELTRVGYHHEFYPKLWWPGLFLRADSPVDLTLVDPRGGEHSKSSWDLTEAIYLEADIDGDGSSEDLILLEQREFGEYRAKVLPEQGASPEDTFDLIARVRGVRETLARGAKISQIPEEGYPISSPEKTWYLAEGCTAQGMQTYILVQNPGSEAAHIKLTFQTGRGEVPGPEVDLPGGRRTTFLANTYVPNNTDVSTKVESDKPVICERAMYGAGMVWAHDSIGVTTPSPTWYLAEGCTAQGMQTYILVQNPGSEAAHIKLTFQTGRGEVPGPEVDLPGGRRTTFLANTYVPNNTDVSTKVESDKPVICERAMYGAGMVWAHDSIGVTTPSPTWYLAEGCTAQGMQTYILVQNPGSEAAHIKLTFQTGRGEVPGPEVDLPGGRRITFLANTYVPNNTDVSTKVESDKPVICERAMYGAGMAWAHDAVGYAP